MASTLAQAVIPQVTSSSTNIIQAIEYYSSRYWYEYGDHRVHKSALLGGGPGQMLAIVLTYLIAVTLFGPYMMRKRKPMENLIWPIRAYNAFMVLFNAYLFAKFTIKTNWCLDCWGCTAATKRLDQEGLAIIEMMLLSRYFDFFDSIFFVCRKKFDHLTILHVLHHSLVPIIVWSAGKLAPTTMIVFAGYINLPIHVIMYSYYGLSTFPSLRKFLWWKKYLTTIQIIQFGIDLVHSLHVYFIPNCKFHFLLNVQTAFSLTFLFLFCQFYLRSYIKGKNSTNPKSTLTVNGEDNSKHSITTAVTKQMTNIQSKKFE